MSGTLAEKRPSVGWVGRSAPRPAEEERAGHLEVVTTRSQRRSRPRAVYAVIATGVLFGIVVGQLLLSITISQGAYQISSLQSKQTELQRAYQAASEDLDRLTSPQNLAANANALGMVTNSNPAYLRLSDGAVLGAPVAVSATAATVTGAQGNLVPNVLLNGVPLAVPVPPAANAANPNPAAPANSPSAGGAPVSAPPATVPLDGALPTPVTH